MRQPTKRCPNCGSLTAIDARVCGQCGRTYVARFVPQPGERTTETRSASAGRGSVRMSGAGKGAGQVSLSSVVTAAGEPESISRPADAPEGRRTRLTRIEKITLAVGACILALFAAALYAMTRPAVVAPSPLIGGSPAVQAAPAAADAAVAAPPIRTESAGMAATHRRPPDIQIPTDSGSYDNPDQSGDVPASPSADAQGIDLKLPEPVHKQEAAHKVAAKAAGSAHGQK